mmetsp:Transcript_21196/g.59749  ORF Transcript_21196/g.59749 Transcript_21196/m.59749 type:complete len:235 (-) Transcript_21196:214-918(-)
MTSSSRRVLSSRISPRRASASRRASRPASSRPPARWLPTAASASWSTPSSWRRRVRTCTARASGRLPWATTPRWSGALRNWRRRPSSRPRTAPPQRWRARPRPRCCRWTHPGPMTPGRRSLRPHWASRTTSRTTPVVRAAARPAWWTLRRLRACHTRLARPRPRQLTARWEARRRPHRRRRPQATLRLVHPRSPRSPGTAATTSGPRAWASRRLQPARQTASGTTRPRWPQPQA